VLPVAALMAADLAPLALGLAMLLLLHEFRGGVILLHELGLLLRAARLLVAFADASVLPVAALMAADLAPLALGLAMLLVLILLVLLLFGILLEGNLCVERHLVAAELQRTQRARGIVGGALGILRQGRDNLVGRRSAGNGISSRTPKHSERQSEEKGEVHEGRHDPL